MSVVLSPYHAAVQPEAAFRCVLRGYAGSSEPVWEYDVGELGMGDDRAVRLSDLEIPPPPSEQGGILEVHPIRLDRPPAKGTGFAGMWIDAQTADGGGYLIPTIPIRGQAKSLQRDDLQVVPGVLSSDSQETELILLNPIDEPTEVKLVVSSVDGLVTEGKPFAVGAWSAWRAQLSRAVPRARKLLATSDGLGSLAIYSSHRLLPYFGFRNSGRSVLSMDHAAPIFA